MKWCVGSDWKQAIKCPGHGFFAVVSVVSWEHNVLLICPQLGSETELEERNSVSATIILALKLRWSRSRLFCVSSVLSLPENFLYDTLFLLLKLCAWHHSSAHWSSACYITLVLLISMTRDFFHRITVDIKKRTYMATDWHKSQQRGNAFSFSE